jgi:hypothetical protein
MSPTSPDPREVVPSRQEYRLIRGETVSLRAGLDVLAALERMVWDGVRAFPKRGLEVGGILTGSWEGEICLEAVRPLPMEYRSSPAFQPSPADLLFVKQSVLWARAAGTSILGHFRSQTSGEPAPADADQTIADLLKLRMPLLVLVPASAAGIEQARVYRRVNGEWAFLLSFPLVEFPSDRATPQPMQKRAIPIPRASAVASPRRRWYPWALAGMAVGLGCGAFLSHSIWRTAPAYMLPTRSDVNLQVHPESAGLKVQWDPASRPVIEGISGMLTVQDGDRHLQIPLDRQQLHAGSTFYYPESGWVEVRLEIYRDGSHYTGEAVAMATGVSAPQLPTGSADANSSSAAPPASKPAPPKRRSIRKRPPAGKKARKKTGRAPETTAQHLPRNRALAPASSNSVAPRPLAPPISSAPSAPAGPPSTRSAGHSAGAPFQYQRCGRAIFSRTGLPL